MRSKQDIIDWLESKGRPVSHVDPYDRLLFELLIDIREILNGGPV